MKTRLAGEIRKQPMWVTRDEFLKILDIYIDELGDDPCFAEARDYYAARDDGEAFALDANGNPGPQLKVDWRAVKKEALKEFYEAARKARVVVVLREDQLRDRKFAPDKFTQSVRKILSRAHLTLEEPIVITLEEGVKKGLKGRAARLVEEWREVYLVEYEKYRQECRRTGVKGYKELSLFTFVGFAGGLGLGAILDRLGFSASALGEWAVRTLSGEGEDLAEGTWVLQSRLHRRGAHRKETAEQEEEEELEEEGLVWVEREAAEAYGIGKIAGMTFPWAVDVLSRFAGVDVRAPEGSYVAYLYSLADQIGANIAGLRHHVKKAGSMRAGLANYFRDPIMISSLTVITLPLLILYLVRSAGFRPSLLFLAALEGVLLNLCWVPPLTAWFWDYRLQKGLRDLTERYAKMMEQSCVSSPM